MATFTEIYIYFQEIDLKPCSENIDRLKKMSNETADIIGKLDVIKQTIMGFSTHESKSRI